MAVIGGGPAGLSAGIVLSRCNRRVVLIDAGHGRNQSSEHVNNYLGANGISPEELRRRGTGVFVSFGGALLTPCAVTSVRRTDSGFMLRTSRGDINVLAVILATGQRDRLPPVPGLERHYGRQIHHCPYCDAMMHVGERIAVIGGDDAACSMALNLLSWTPHVILLPGEEQMDNAATERVEARGVRIVRGCIQACMDDGNSPARLAGLLLNNNQHVSVDAVFFPSQAEYGSALHEDLACRLNEAGQIEVDDHQRASIPGLYVAGDATGVGSLAIIAAAEGARAAMTAHEDLLLVAESVQRSSASH